MADVPPNGAAAGFKSNPCNTLNSSCMNYSGNTNSSTDMQGISYSRELPQASSLKNNASAMQVVSSGCLDGGMFTHVPVPPNAMLQRTTDSIDQLAASGVRRLDSSLSFSSSAPYVPVTAQQWNYAWQSSAAPEGTQNAAPCVYTNVPSNGVLVRMMDPSGNAVWCIQSDYNNSTNIPPPPPVLQSPPQQPQQQRSVSITSPLQTSVLESPNSSQPAQTLAGTTVFPPPFKVPPLAWNFHASLGATGRPATNSPDAQPGRGTSSPPIEGDADDYEYEPYNSNTLANRRVGSLDRVRCKVHGKERSAQNMVMVRSKVTNDIHWRCKRSSQCKVRTTDSDDTPINSKESTLHSIAAEALLSPTSDQGYPVALNTFPPSTNVPWNRQLPAPPQYTLMSSNSGAIPSDTSLQPISQSVYTHPQDGGSQTAHVVTRPSAFSQKQQQCAPNAVYYQVFAQENGSQQLPMLPPQQSPQQSQQGSVVMVNGVPYRIVHVENTTGHMR
ncbi:hypothetical protein ABL78_4048 [Leptomonas seymouri]|uniref:Uncharacterized protein n=1 Tax=Leptomonas seymouri TaxID=5684 RepID=A0A0N1I6Y5_LEPSE|nr:hypothetical protein ABL78_4048 [Leptomonas seymouri]|eukprot:KPI86858.1 hypothetical protein ABL78_4048 [Leptomonas seymouri]